MDGTEVSLGIPLLEMMQHDPKWLVHVTRYSIGFTTVLTIGGMSSQVAFQTTDPYGNSLVRYGKSSFNM